jgi:hypothetical protein
MRRFLTAAALRRFLAAVAALALAFAASAQVNPNGAFGGSMRSARRTSSGSSGRSTSSPAARSTW